MSDIESEREGSENGTSEMTFIAEKIRAHPEILEKSQIPAMKRKKTTAVTKIIEEYVILFGKRVESEAFMKKVNNMKTRLKNKTDKNKTGNKPIPLLPWEKLMVEAMNADINPVLSQVPGAVAIGVPTLQPTLPIPINGIVTDSDAHQMAAYGMAYPRKRSSEFEQVAPKKLPPKSSVVNGRPKESVETRQLTTIQLQQLVLLEQLKATCLQQEYFSAKLEKLAKTSQTEPSIMHTVAGYCGLQSYCDL